MSPARTTAPSDDGPRARVAYDEKAIKTLDALEHIRLRTGMYIGRIGDGTHYDDGFYILLKEVVDNAIDEFIMGDGRRVEITRDGKTVSRARLRPRHPAGQGGRLRLRDQHRRQVQRRRLPVQRRPERRRHQGGQRAVGALHGAKLPRGEVQARHLQPRPKQMEKGGAEAKQRDGTFVEFAPDPEIFGEFDWNEELIEHRLRYYSFLNTGLKLVYNGAASRARQAWPTC